MKRRVDALRAGEAVVARTAPAADASMGDARTGVPIAAGTRDGSTVAALDAAQAALAPASSTNGAGAVLPGEPLVAVVSTPNDARRFGRRLGSRRWPRSERRCVGRPRREHEPDDWVNIRWLDKPRRPAARTSRSAPARRAAARALRSARVSTSAPPAARAPRSAPSAEPSAALSLGATVSVGGASPGLLGTGVNVVSISATRAPPRRRRRLLLQRPRPRRPRSPCKCSAPLRCRRCRRSPPRPRLPSRRPRRGSPLRP